MARNYEQLEYPALPIEEATCKAILNITKNLYKIKPDKQ